MRFPSETRFKLNFAAMYFWRVTKADVRSAFLQAETAKRDIYVRSLFESQD